MGKLFKPLGLVLLPILAFLGHATAAIGQEVIVNGTFNTNVAGWALDPGFGNFNWSSDQTLLLTNDAPPAGQTASVSQCDSITGGIFYDVGARLLPLNFSGPLSRSPGLKRVEHTGSVYVLLDFYSLDGCRGSALQQFVRLTASGPNGQWESLGQSFLSPNSAISVLTSLAILKNQASSDLQVEFDDITITPSAGPPPPPIASFIYTPLNPYQGTAVQFTDTSIRGPTSWSWDFGDPSSGAANTATVKNPAHIFALGGTYTVSLSATNAGGTGSTSQSVNISIPPPVVQYTFAPPSPAPGQSVQFTDGSGGNPTSWSWNFGDPGSGAANTSTLQNPTHVFANPGVYPVSLTAKNSGGTGARNHAVTVALPPPVANFTFTPASPSVNGTVQFTDTSTGAPTGWSWTFGDPGSGASNTSSSPNPSHVFATAGVYTVKLVASNSGGSSTQTASVTVTSFSTRSVSLPVAGHVTGMGGTVFLTDVLIENPNAGTEAATLFFYPVGGGSPSQTALSLAPLETRSLPDIVANEFAVTNSFGALRLDTVGSPPAPLRMTSRTYDRVGAGTFGMAVSGVLEGGSLASQTMSGPQSAVSVPSRFVTGLQRNTQFRSNLGGVNDSASSESFAIVLRGTDGTVMGTSQAFTLAPSGQWQMGIKDLFPSVTADALTAEFQSVGSSTVPVGYGTLADNASGDLTYFPSLRPASAFLLPVTSRVTGVGGAVFASDLTLANVSDSPVTVTLTFWAHDKDNSSGAPQASLTLAPRETRLVADALNTLFGLSETFGALKIDSAGSLAVAERIWTASPTTAGTVGQQVDPMVLPDALYSRASILGLRQDSAFRSNAGFVNPNDSAATISLTLLRPNGMSIGTTAITVPPRGFTQFSLAGLFPGVAFPTGELLTISLDSGTTLICAYGIIADNVSQDLTASPALP